ncbi:MAG: dihydroorotate dehydrogenase electron transfer subunit [Desulfobacteraceae bacterium]|nr:dihydroorotate dehydrogenase electron transfer subunit [Desulfobacteraceae bacterium]
MFQQPATILWNENVNSAYYRMGLSCEGTLLRAVPGQFIMVRLKAGNDLLLRRPFSIHGIVTSRGNPRGIELLYKVVGKGTFRLSEYREGDSLDVIGPLGNGFTISESYERIHIVSGGIGVAPLRFLAMHIERVTGGKVKPQVFLGGRSDADLLCTKEFIDLGLPVQITTDDGSSGDQCLITDPWEVSVSVNPPQMIYACGPMSMLQCIGGIVSKHGLLCEASIESAMACGIGACLGCVVRAKDINEQYKHVCIDGPVFNIQDLKI